MGIVYSRERGGWLLDTPVTSLVRGRNAGGVSTASCLLVVVHHSCTCVAARCMTKYEALHTTAFPRSWLQISCRLRGVTKCGTTHVPCTLGPCDSRWSNPLLIRGMYDAQRMLAHPTVPRQSSPSIRLSVEGTAMR